MYKICFHIANILLIKFAILVLIAIHLFCVTLKIDLIMQSITYFQGKLVQNLKNNINLLFTYYYCKITHDTAATANTLVDSSYWQYWKSLLKYCKMIIKLSVTDKTVINFT